MVPPLRFQNLHLGRPWPGTTPSLSELLSDNETFHGFEKAVEIKAATQPIRNRMAADAAIERRRYLERDLVGLVSEATAHQTDPAPSRIQSKLTEVLDQTRRQIDETFNKPTTPDDVIFAAGDDGAVTMFAVPHGRRMGLYFETEAAMRAFRNRLDDTSLSPLPRYVMPEPVSDRIELEHGLPLIVADEIIWKMITTRSPQLIDLWLNPPDIFASALKEPVKRMGDRS